MLSFFGKKSNKITGVVCPYCKSPNISTIPDGKNVQRYECGSCYTSFSEVTNTFWHGTHLSLALRQMLISEYQRHTSLRKVATITGLNRNTVTLWFNKMTKEGVQKAINDLKIK